MSIFSEEFRARMREVESNRRRGISLARRASAVLRRAGFVKAGRYSTFGGYEPDGYYASESGNGTSGVRAVVGFTTSHRPPSAAIRESEAAAEFLNAAGFNVTTTTYGSIYLTGGE
jgi:hypothetical protein